MHVNNTDILFYILIFVTYFAKQVLTERIAQNYHAHLQGLKSDICIN